MNTKITKWGNSLGVRIPQALAARIGIQENMLVELSAEEDAIVIKPAQRKCSLRDLTEKITKDNKPESIDWGASLGKEAW
jgi:antitoxin MazE